VADKTGAYAKVLATNQPFPAGVATDGTRVYWINSTAPGTVMSCVIANCMGSTGQVAGKQPSPLSIVADGTSLFWADFGVPGVQAGSLNRVPLL
jgi:hypothetical protein